MKKNKSIFGQRIISEWSSVETGKKEIQSNSATSKNERLDYDSEMVKFYGYSLVMTLRTAPHLASLCFYYLLIMVFHFKDNYMSLYLMVNLSKNHFRPGSLFQSKCTNASIVLICQVQRLELCRIPHNKPQWKKKQIHVWYLKRRSMFV